MNALDAKRWKRGKIHGTIVAQAHLFWRYKIQWLTAKKKKKRFSKPGYGAIRNIEQLILNETNVLEYQNQLEDVLSDYSEEINQYRLSTQLQILKTKFVDKNEKTVSAAMNYMKNNIGVKADFYPEIIVLLRLYLGLSAMNVASK